MGIKEKLVILWSVSTKGSVFVTVALLSAAYDRSGGGGL